MSEAFHSYQLKRLIPIRITDGDATMFEGDARLLITRHPDQFPDKAARDVFWLQVDEDVPGLPPDRHGYVDVSIDMPYGRVNAKVLPGQRTMELFDCEDITAEGLDLVPSFPPTTKL